MTIEQWNNLEENSSINSSAFNYKLLFKDLYGIWLVEQVDIHTKVSRGFKKLQPRTKDIRSYHVVR